MAVTASAPAYSAGEMAELFEDAMIFFTDGGFDDSSDPNLRTYCESHDKLHRVIPLLGTPRFDRIVKATDGIERAQSDMTELLFVLISDAAAYATTIAAGEEPLAWVLFDIATYVLHSDHDVQQKMAFAAKHGLTRTKMFTTPKFTTVCCEGRKELISWLDRIYGGARRTTSLSASGERLQ
jgi:hypothetical protein